MGESKRNVIVHHAISGIGASAPERGAASLQDDGFTYWNADIVEEIR